MSILKNIFSTARFVSANQAPHIHAKLNELAQKAGIKNGIELILCDHPLPNAAFIPTPFIRNAPHTEKQYIFITKGLLDTLGDTLHGPVGSELETILAHELSHAKHSGIELAAKTLPLLLMPLAAMVGVHLYDTATKKQAAQPALSKADALDAAHAEAQKQFTPDEQNGIPLHVQKSIGDQLLTAGKYLAAAALGLAAGLFIVKHGSNRAEYRADRFATTLTGKGEQLISALEKIRLSTEAFLAQGEKTLMNPVKKIFLECMLSHPTNADRAAAIRRL